MKGKNFLVAILLALGFFFSACSERTVASADQYPAEDDTQIATTETVGAGAEGTEPASTDSGITREDVATTGEGIDTENMSAASYDDASFAELPAATQQLVMPMRDMMEQMRGLEMAGDVDQYFAKLMIYHHQGAINMANQVIQSGDNAEIIERARQLIITKEQEIEQLQQYAGTIGGTPSQQMGASGITTDTTGATGTRGMAGSSESAESGEVIEQLKGATEGTMSQLQQEALNGDVDHDFAHIMILHHQDAIEMAEVEMQDGQNQEVKAIAEKIIENNRQQIQALDTWTSANDG